MTALPEARLAREAEMCYATLAVVTDYDVWHPREADVTAELVIANLRQGVSLAQAAVRRAVGALPRQRAGPGADALRDALLTPFHLVPEETKERLRPIIGRYLGEGGGGG